MKQLLEPSEWAQKAAHRPAQQHACQNEEARHIVGGLEPGGADHRLQGPDGAGCGRRGAGVAVQPRNAGGLQPAPENLSVEEIHQKRVGGQGRPQLDLPAVSVVTQCPHTPNIS